MYDKGRTSSLLLDVMMRMIRAFSATYLRFEDENNKRKDQLLVIEILNKEVADIQLMVFSQTDLLISSYIKEITEIKGYHRYLPASDHISPFGIGGLKKLKTDSKDGMLESLANQFHIDYNTLAKNFGRGLLLMEEDYIALLD